MILPPTSLPLDLSSTAVRLRNLALGLLLVPALGAPAAAQCEPTKYRLNESLAGQSLGEIVVADGFAYVDQYYLDGTYYSNVQVQGGGYGCYIYSVTDPENPVQVGFIENYGGAVPMWVSDNRLYMGGNPFRVFDVSDPSNPQLLGSRPMLCCTYNNNLVVVNDVAYLAGGGELRAFDVSDVALASYAVPYPSFNPILGSIALGGWNQSVVVRDNLVLVASDTGGVLKIVDASDPTNLTLLSTVPLSGTGLAVEGDYAYLARGVGQPLTVIDISNPAAPVVRGSVYPPEVSSGLYEVVVSGNRVYGKIVNADGVAVFDVSDPDAPAFLARAHSTTGSNGDIAVVGGRAYTTTHRSFTIWDVASCVSQDTPPTANAGADFSVDEGQPLVTLNGSASSDPDNDPLTYAWEQVPAPTVVLTGADSATPSFDAPFVTANTTLTFKLTVTANGESATDTVDVTVVNVNHLPVADAGEDQSVAEGTLGVALNGSDSYDDDMDTLSYSWLQIGGPAVSLSGTTAAEATFDAPYVEGSGAPGVVATLDFQLTVDDGYGGSATDVVSVEITNVNNAPTAAAGADQTVDENTPVSLAGSGSDPDGDALTYWWLQTGGTGVVLTGADTATPSFTAPFVNPGGGDLAFQLTVADGYGGLATDQVVVHVLNANDPPLVSAAAPTLGTLWPPTHGLVSVGITGVSDPDNNATIVITAVTQDEPTNGLGDGDTAVDAIINPDGTVLLRAERSALGNGRVYHVHFTASDLEGSVSGVVTVSVPKSKKSTAVDDGELYDSTN